VRGTIRWFDAKKGYGFITPDGGGRDVFLHHTEMNQDSNSLSWTTFHEGEAVEFETTRTLKGLRAVNVSVIN